MGGTVKILPFAYLRTSFSADPTWEVRGRAFGPMNGCQPKGDREQNYRREETDEQNFASSFIISHIISHIIFAILIWLHRDDSEH